MLPRSLISIAAAMAMLAAGCSPSYSSVSGVAYLDDAPLTGGIVSAIQPDGKIVTAQIGTNGAYRLENVMVGSVKIIVLNEQESMAPGTEEIVKKFGADGPPPAKKSSKPMIHDRYSNPETSGLSVTVKSTDTPFDIRLTR